ncbi:dipeptidase [Sphingomonas baiyangensis]|uniref:Membrane dipeptidase n=1 Tax=Sphingomonas baiyangensis TaxID=2572576 RepID=A0A4U1L367_9SPHN|nr:dipeptidase [Sphingomonas baiyangensis]TKD51337.1 membrane dipeptidase [Sphingomonas baiyangensis]
MRIAIAGLLLTALTPLPAAAQDAASIERRVEALVAARVVIDGHNDLPWELRDRHGGVDAVDRVDLMQSTDRLDPPLQTDIPRLRRGGYGGQFWSLWIPASVTGPAAVKMTIEEIDIVRRMVARYPEAFALADTAAEVEAARRSGRIAALMGIEGGHQIDNSLAVLRRYRDLGVLYMTLTHSKHVGWADSATDAPAANGLADFGRAVIAEMNRIGMIVDLSHVSPETARAALAVTRAPVIFSHSNAFAVNPHPRNVPDDVLRATAANGGVVMVNVYPPFVSDAVRRWNAARDAARDAAAFAAANPRPAVGVGAVADHVEHIARVAGRAHVGLGGDYDGIGGDAVAGMAGVDGWRALFAELMRRGWSDADIAALAGGNVLRVMRGVEKVAAAAR